MIEIELVVAAGLAAPAPDRDEIERAVAAVLDEAGVDASAQTVTVDLRLVARAESAGLNGRYRDKPHATNVLSFPADARLPGLRVLGDLVICLPVVTAEAAAQDKSEPAHFMHMVVHGCFHLLGFDHIGEDEAMRMEAAETRVMARLGYADPYARRAPDAPAADPQ